MKMRTRKPYRLIGIILGCILLASLVPAVMANVGVSHPLADKMTAFHKVTSEADLKENSMYVILYKDATTETRCALSTTPTDTFCAQLEQTDPEVLMADTKGTYVFTAEKQDENGALRLVANNGQYLRFNGTDGIFSNTNAYTTMAQDEETGYWSVRNLSARSLTFSGGAFGMTSGQSALAPFDFEIWTADPTTTYVKLATLDQLADFDDDTEFVITVVTEDGRFAMGTRNSEGSWMYKVEYSEDEGTSFIEVNDADPIVFNFHGEFRTGTFNKVRYWGFDERGIGLKNGYYYYPQNLEKVNPPYPFRSTPGEIGEGTKNHNNVQFEYGTGENDSNNIYIRGNGEATYLGYDGTNYTGALTQDSEYRLPVEIYVPFTDSAVRVEYMNAEGEVGTVVYSEKQLSLVARYPDVEHDGNTYSFVGWTMTKPESAFLPMEESYNIYDYDHELGQSRISYELMDKYDLEGYCNPDMPGEILNFAEKEVEPGSTLALYPIYAVHGFDTVVTANDKTAVKGDDGVPVVGVSDWKADPAQGLDLYYSNDAAEKWLGYIDVEIYKDGALWVGGNEEEPVRIFFRYHDDCSADLSIKFVWDELLNDELYVDPDGNLEPLYLYMSDHDQFPEFDQTGNYIIDAVIAEQGGSQEGLLYRLNWMTNHGGQLDNVVGGSTVKIFVTTKYNVKYYLNDEEITDPTWANSNTYTTPGTENLFNDMISVPGVEYKHVRPDNELFGLMDRNYPPKPEEPAAPVTPGVPDDQETTEEPVAPVETEDPMDERYESAAARGQAEVFTYLMEEYPHEFNLAVSPEDLMPVAEENEYALRYNSWKLKDENGNKVDMYNWEYLFEITGDVYTSGNTASAYKDAAVKAPVVDTTPYTFHLYEYYAIPGNLFVSNKIEGEGADKTRDFHYTVVLDDDGINGEYGGITFVDGVGEFTLSDEEDITIEGLPGGVGYKVTETDANEDGYTTTVETESGEIVGGQTERVEYLNEKPIETPEPTETVEPTETPEETETPEPTETPKATETPKPTETPKATETPKPVETPEATETPEPTETPVATDSPNPPNTGDNTVAVWVVLAIAVMAAVVFAAKRSTNPTK